MPLSTSFGSLSVKNEQSGRISAPLASKLPSEDSQLAWAARESLKVEEERRKLQEKEDAELAMALKLSKLETTKR